MAPATLPQPRLPGKSAVQPAGCTNLRDRFGRCYRVEYEESYHAQYGPDARREDPQYMLLPCRYGHIYAWQGDDLAASVDGHPNVASVLRRLPYCRVWQDGDFGELTILFDVADFAEVAKIMRPRRRRQLSQAQRDRLRAMGFQKGQQDHAHVQPTAQGCVPIGQDDSQIMPEQWGRFGSLARS